MGLLLKKKRANVFAVTGIISIVILCVSIFGFSKYIENHTIPSENIEAAGSIYYVSPNGSGTICSSSSPCSQSTGYSKLSAGDTLYFKSGTYKQTGRFSIAKSDVTIATAPNEPSKAIITGDTDGDGDADVPAKYQGLVELNGNRITVKNLEITFAYSSAIQSYGSNNVIENNIIKRASDRNFCGGGAGRGCTGDWEAGIAYGAVANTNPPGASPNIIIRGNTVYNTSGEGIICMHSDGGLIENNKAYDNWAINIYLDQCANTIVKNNLAYYTNDAVWWRFSGSPAVNIAFADEGISAYPAGHDRKFINNISVGGASNFSYWNGNMPNSGMVNDLVAFNTLVEARGNSPKGIDINRGSLQTNSKIINNIILQSAGTPLLVGSSTGISFSNNLWSRTPTVTGSNDITSNPLLVDPNHIRTPGAVLADWYKLTSSSPAINRGIYNQTAVTDYFGNSRSNPPDIGAHEYGGTVVTTTSIPFTPTSTLKTGDVNRDGVVNILDFQLLSNSFGKSPGQTGFNPNADINKDNLVNILDFQLLSNSFGG